MRLTSRVLTAGLMVTLAAACGQGGGSAAPSPTTPAPAPKTRVLRFSHHPADRTEQATMVSLWFAGDVGGALVAVRSSRVAAPSGRLLQETSYRRGGRAYVIVDHEACVTDSDVEPPSAATVDALIADTIGPLDAPRPTSNVDDGQVTMSISQPTADLSSRVVRLLDSASGDEVARIDGISLSAADPASVDQALTPLRCTPSPKPSATR